MLDKSKSVKIKHFAAAVCTALIVVNFMSGCRNISEEAPMADSLSSSAQITSEEVQQSSSSVLSETTVESMDKTNPEKEETALTTPSDSETEVNSDTAESMVTEIETVENSEKPTTTAATLQTESPSEITSEITTVKETESVVVYGSNSYTTLNYKEQKGVWISYLEYDSILKNKSEASFRKSIGEYFDNIKGLDFNTVYVQARAYGDAYYDSELFPSGDRFNGTMGTSESFDALQIMLDEGHNRGLSVHAWINPMRLMTDKQMQSLSDSYTVKKWYNDSSKNGRYIVKSGDRWYLNPAYSAVKQLIADGITEITANYDVDGIQIDDYFYPTTAAAFDSEAYNNSGTSQSLSEWRIKNVNDMVKTLYKATHSANSSAVFGISPQGSVENNYNELYADVKVWCGKSGYCDYILPQVYFGFDNAALPYGDTISVWSNMTSSSDVKLVIGLAVYKIGAEDTYAGQSGKNEWLNNSDIISRQMTLAKALRNYGGVALFRYGSLFNPSSEVSAQVSKELENILK